MTLLNLLILSIRPSINSLIVVLRGDWARRGESRRLEIGGCSQWIGHILAIQNKLNNISEVYITFDIWSRLMETCNQDFYSLRAIWHAQGPHCVNEDFFAALKSHLQHLNDLYLMFDFPFKTLWWRGFGLLIITFQN